MGYVNVEISFKTAEPSILELLPTAAELTAASETWSNWTGPTDEYFWLATCNRVEFFAAFENTSPDTIIALVSDAIGFSGHQLEGDHVLRQGMNAVEHLVRLAAGLESMAIGEPNIAGQVRSAFDAARENSSVGPQLSRAFDHAMHVAKRVKAETELGLLGPSLLEHGLAEAELSLGGLSGRSALVVGLGAVGSQAVRALCAAGADSVRVLGRRPGTAEQFVERFDGPVMAEVRPIDEAVACSDIVVAASSARSPLVRAEELRAVRGGSSKKQVLLDLARPRDIEPECASLPGVDLINIERMAGLMEQRNRLDAVDDAASIIEQESARFAARIANTSAGPIMRAMRSSANALVEEELGRLERRLPDLSTHDISEAKAALYRLAGKFLHQPLVRARILSSDGEHDHYFDALGHIFGTQSQNGGEQHVK